jgi:hypothetical protein
MRNYANIPFIFVETNSIDSFNACLSFYSRFIDDGICLWHASDDDSRVFSQYFSQAYFHRRSLMSTQASNSFGLCSHREPLSVACQVRFQPVQSSIGSSANRAMHMPIFSMARSMSETHYGRGSKLYSQQRRLTLLIILNGATVMSCCSQNSGNKAMQRSSHQNKLRISHQNFLFNAALLSSEFAPNLSSEISRIRVSWGDFFQKR